MALGIGNYFDTKKTRSVSEKQRCNGQMSLT
jgi:hypothetical protein